jgi:hypothetical protein
MLIEVDVLILLVVLCLDISFSIRGEQPKFVRFEVFTAVTMKNGVF